MTTTQHGSDTLLKSMINEELKWAPGVDPTHIGVGVTDGAVTLSGEVESYPERRLAEKAAQRVRGVRAIAESITVRGTLTGSSNDTDIARAAGTALGQAVDIAKDSVKATVKNGVVTLTGTVPWRYQRGAAERSIRYLRGVRDVQNEIGVKPVVSTSNIKHGVEQALVRQAALDARKCRVTSDAPGEVVLEGTVGTWVERGQVERSAWASPGVNRVHNRLRVVD